MNHSIRTIFLSLALLVAGTGSSWSQDFDKGFAAAQSGDYATALQELRPLAEQGYASAQTLVGLMYATGRGVPQDDKEAVKWYRLSADQGLPMPNTSWVRCTASGEEYRRITKKL